MSSDFELPSKAKQKTTSAPTKHAPIVNPALLKPSLGQNVETESEPQSSDEGKGKIDPDSIQRPSLDLSKFKFEEEELLAIFDTLIFTKEYSEEFKLRGKYPVTFRVRNAKEVNEIQRAIDASNLNLISSVEALRSITNLKYALVSFGDKDLSMAKPDDREKFISELPAPLIGMMLNYLAVFDYKVSEATRVGNENF